MQSDDDLEKIVAFPTRDNSALDMAGLVHVRGELCRHPQILVNEKQRTIVCKTCGSCMDPFGYLLDIAHRRTILAGNVDALRKEERYRRDNIAKLIKLERNIKARIRRAENNA